MLELTKGKQDSSEEIKKAKMLRANLRKRYKSVTFSNNLLHFVIN